MDKNENIFSELFGYNTNVFESSIECIEEQQALNEAMLKISSDGKKIKKSIKEKCKEMKKPGRFFQQQINSFKKIDESKIKELDSFIKSLSDKCYISPLDIANYSRDYISKDYIFIKGNKVYSAIIGLDGNGCTLVYFREVDLEAKKNLMPKELINDILQIFSSIQTNGFISENKVGIVRGVKNSKIPLFINKMEDLIKKKYPDIEINSNAFTGNVKFKKNK